MRGIPLSRAGGTTQGLTSPGTYLYGRHPTINPFDRMRIAQAQIERLTLVAHDPKREKPAPFPYGVPLILHSIVQRRGGRSQKA